MPSATPLADVAVTPAALLEHAAEARSRADQAERDLLAVAVEWAHSHPSETGRAWRAPTSGGPDGDGTPDPATQDEEAHEWFGLPEVAWDAPAALAAAVGLSTAGGRSLIRDALILRHRLPHLQHRLDRGDLAVWRARRIAAAVTGAPADVVAHLDVVLAPDAHSIGTTALDRRIDQAMLELHSEEREQAQLDELDARRAVLDERTLGHTGIAEMTIRGDWADLHTFDQALSRVAAALAGAAEPGSADSHTCFEARRTEALAVLADPARALALLEGRDPPAPRQQILARLHLTDANLLGLDPATTDASGRALLDAAVRAWCGRADAHLTILPIIDTGQVLITHHHDTGYVVPAGMRRLVETLEPDCVFPWCTRPAHACDFDHRRPWRDDEGLDPGEGAGGPTCPCNLAPLCRHHHRLKTLAGWRYDTIEPRVHIWTDPHGRRYRRDGPGTRDLPAT